MPLRFFADHCVAHSIMEALETSGHKVISLKHHLPTNAPDPAVLAKAQELNAVLLSLNGDFADIVRYPPAKYKGIVALQVRNHPEITMQLMARLTDYLSAYPQADHYAGRLFLVEVHRIRVRR